MKILVATDDGRRELLTNLATDMSSLLGVKLNEEIRELHKLVERMRRNK